MRVLSPAKPGETPVPERRRSRLPVLLPILAVSILALVGVTHRLPYYVVAPGPTSEVDRLIAVPGGRAFPHRGAFLLTSVSLRTATAFEALRARLDPDVDLVRIRTLIGVAPSKEARKQFDVDLRHSMQVSQHVAVVVALGRLGLPQPEPGDPKSAITISDGGVDGGSGGLALTLGVLDALADGDLTGGHRVAVTGTIAPSGRVGDVDGVAQKAAAARRAGAEYLLVPPGGFNEARAHAGRTLQVVQVSTLDDALGVLAEIGGTIGDPR